MDAAGGGILRMHRGHARRHDDLGDKIADHVATRLPSDRNDGFVAISEKTGSWLGLEQEPSVWIGFVASMVLLALVLRKG